MHDNSSVLGDRLVTMAEVTAMIGTHRATIYKWMDEGKFPSHITLGPRMVRWKLSEVKAWMDNLQPTYAEKTADARS